MIRIRCPGCDRLLAMKASAAGEVRKCPACEKKFRVPDIESDLDDPPASSGIRPAAERKPSRSDGYRKASTPQKPAPPPRRPKQEDEEDEVYEDLEVVSTKPKRKDEEDEEEPRRRPSVNKRRPRDDEDAEDYDEGPRERRPRRRKKRRRFEEEGSDVFSWVSPFMLCCAGLALLWLVLTGLGFMWPRAGTLLFGVGILLAVLSRIWILVIASQEGDLRNVLIIPFYEIVFIINHIGETWKPMILSVIGVFMLLTGGCFWVVHDAEEGYYDSRPGIHQPSWYHA